jgi:hypothetical protein
LDGNGGAVGPPSDFGLGEVEPWWGWWEPVVAPDGPADDSSYTAVADDGPAEPDEQPVPNGERTREALSRYQASRQAARALVEREDIDFHAEPPGSGTAPQGGSGGGRP